MMQMKIKMKEIKTLFIIITMEMKKLFIITIMENK